MGQASVPTHWGWVRLPPFASDDLLGFGAVHDGRLVFRRMRYGAASSLTWIPISGLSCSAICAGRTLLAWESVLRLGGVAPRRLSSGPECKASASQTSLSPML